MKKETQLWVSFLLIFFKNKIVQSKLCCTFAIRNFRLMENPIKYVQDTFVRKEELPAFNPGDNVSVAYKIIEGGKERIQIFKGDVINIRGEGTDKMFTVRKMTNGIGVERVFPLHSPYIDSITINKIGKVRRAKLFYLRELTGKSARIKEKR